MENSNLINELYKKNKQEEKYETIIKELRKQVQDLQRKGSQKTEWKEKYERLMKKLRTFKVFIPTFSNLHDEVFEILQLFQRWVAAAFERGRTLVYTVYHVFDVYPVNDVDYVNDVNDADLPQCIEL